MGAPGRVGPGDDLSLGRVNGQLGQSGVEQLDVVGGRARSGVAGAQQGGQGLSGGVEEGDHGGEAEAVLVGGRRPLLLRRETHQGGVEVDDVKARVQAR